jgi:hypothetical protein
VDRRPIDRPRYYDRAGNPLELMEWARMFEDGGEDYRRVAYDLIVYGEGHAEISTVWLGLDHNFSMYGPPLIFETMVFGGPDEDEMEQHRYSTEEEARIGHAGVVEMVSLKIMMEARP